jgi:hypothetical protein
MSLPSNKYKNPPRETFFLPYRKGDDLHLRCLRACVVNENENFADVIEVWGTEFLITEGPSAFVPPVIEERYTRYNIKVTQTSRDKFISEYVRPLIISGRGWEELVDHNPKLVYPLFQTYSNNWPVIADKHIEVMQNLCEQFLNEIVQYVWPRDIRTRIWRDVVKPEVDVRLQNAQGVLEELKEDRF